MDSVLEYFKKSRYALLVEGAKATGKTTTCMQLTEQHFHLDNQDDFERVETNHNVLFEGAGSVLIDEWQFNPHVWNTVRHKVDAGDFKGTIFLTGSSPSLQPWVHSGSGRILRFKMRPLSIEEREIETPGIRISQMLDFEQFKNEDEISFRTDINIENYIDEIFDSGFPGIRFKDDSTQRKHSIESYVDNIVHHDVFEQDTKLRKPKAMKAWLAAYAAATATNATSATIADAAAKDKEGALSPKTIQHYREILQGIGVIEEVEAWLPYGSPFKNLGMSSKHFLVDPALAVALLNVTKGAILKGRRLPESVGKINKTFLGQLFESLVYQSLAVYCEVNHAKLFHFRLRGGEKEIDFIIQKEDVLIAVEVKSKAIIKDDDVKTLNWFEKKIGDEYDVIKLVITVGANAYRRKDGVIVCPLALLGC